jgi:hypothetical protein
MLIGNILFKFQWVAPKWVKIVIQKSSESLSENEKSASLLTYISKTYPGGFNLFMKHCNRKGAHTNAT